MPHSSNPSYPSHPSNDSEYDAQPLPYIPYGVHDEESSYLYNAPVDTNFDTNSPQNGTNDQPSYQSYPMYANTAAQTEPFAQPSVPVGKTRKKRRLWLYAGIIIALLLVGALAFAVTTYLSRSTPQKTLDTFCSAVQHEDYQTAYDQFNPTMKTYFTEPQFASILSSDSVAKCTYGALKGSGNTLTTDFHLLHSKSKKTNNDIVTVSQDAHGLWKISDLKSA